MGAANYNDRGEPGWGTSADGRQNVFSGEKGHEGDLEDGEIRGTGSTHSYSHLCHQSIQCAHHIAD